MREFSYAWSLRSRNKDGGHTIQSAKTRKTRLHAKFMAPCFIEPELLPIELLHCENRDFRPFCFCSDLDLDPITFINELDPYSLEIYQMCKYELPSSKISKVIKSDRQTDRQTKRQTDRQTDTTEIIYHVASRVVSKIQYKTYNAPYERRLFCVSGVDSFTHKYICFGLINSKETLHV